MRKYRMRIKNYEGKSQTAKEAERLRSFIRRHSMNDEQKIRNRELARERMKRYREKKKEKIETAKKTSCSTSCNDVKQKPTTSNDLYRQAKTAEIGRTTHSQKRIKTGRKSKDVSLQETLGKAEQQNQNAEEKRAGSSKKDNTKNLITNNKNKDQPIAHKYDKGIQMLTRNSAGQDKTLKL